MHSRNMQKIILNILFGAHAGFSNLIFNMIWSFNRCFTLQIPHLHSWTRLLGFAWWRDLPVAKKFAGQQAIAFLLLRLKSASERRAAVWGAKWANTTATKKAHCRSGNARMERCSRSKASSCSLKSEMMNQSCSPELLGQITPLQSQGQLAVPAREHTEVHTFALWVEVCAAT